MILAYRRGLLKPDYPNGIQSRLRESMILQSLSAELSADYFLASAQLSAAIWAPSVAPKALTKFAKQLNRQLDYAMDRYEYKDVIYHSQEDINNLYQKQAKEYFAKLRALRASRGEG